MPLFARATVRNPHSLFHCGTPRICPRLAGIFTLKFVFRFDAATSSQNVGGLRLAVGQDVNRKFGFLCFSPSENPGGSNNVVVGAPGFEPGASCAQGRRATRLRYAPTCSALLILKHFPTLLLIRSIIFALDCARTVHE